MINTEKLLQLAKLFDLEVIHIEQPIIMVTRNSMITLNADSDFQVSVAIDCRITQHVFTNLLLAFVFAATIEAKMKG